MARSRSPPQRRHDGGDELGRRGADGDDRQADDRVTDRQAAGARHGPVDEQLGTDDDHDDGDDHEQHLAQWPMAIGGPGDHHRRIRILGRVGCLVPAELHQTGRVGDPTQQQDDPVRPRQLAVERDQVEQDGGRGHRRKVEPQRGPVERDGQQHGAQAEDQQQVDEVGAHDVCRPRGRDCRSPPHRSRSPARARWCPATPR